MITGTVKYVDRGGHYGFISRDDKLPKVYLHVSKVIHAGFDAIEKGQRWEFDLQDGRDGRYEAIDLIFLGYDR